MPQKQISVYIFFLSFFLLSQFSYSQSVLPDKHQIESFFNSKTMVVLESGMFSNFNMEIKDAMEKYWKITPYDFIDADEFREKMQDSTYSFIMLTQSSFEKDKKQIHYDFINFLLGAKYKSLSELPEAASVPLAYAGGDQEYYGFKLGVIIRFVQNRAIEMKEKGIENSMKHLNYYNKASGEIKTKKLVICEGDLQPGLRESAAIKKYYDHEVEIVSADDMAKLVSAGTEDVYFLHVVGPEESQRSGISFKMIFKLSDASLIYYNKHNISEKKPAGFSPQDFKRINK